MEFGEILRELLDERDLTQKQLAHDLNIAPSTIGNYIRDNREPDYATLKRIASYFHVSVDYLLDHQYQQTENHDEDHLLQIFRALAPDQKKIYLEQGKAFLLQSDISKCPRAGQVRAGML